MSRSSAVALVALVCVAGCGGGSRSVDANVEVLPVLQPASGGEMVRIPAGEFTMGDPAGRPDETPHAVSVGWFYLDKQPVTQELYEKIMGVNPSKRRDPKNPVERTQWTDAVRFCNKCSELEGLKPCYDLTSWECDFNADGYRLPTEAEWEYACRASSTSKYCFGDGENDLAQYAWFKPLSEGKPHPVGEKQPNRWGLYDVHGNVWQWCNDWYGETYYAESPNENPRGPATGKMRVLSAAPGIAPPRGAGPRTATRSSPSTPTPASALTATASGGRATPIDPRRSRPIPNPNRRPIRRRTRIRPLP
jgi:formylglycine-generating enzyme required for sulfatase activity